MKLIFIKNSNTLTKVTAAKKLYTNIYIIFILITFKYYKSILTGSWNLPYGTDSTDEEHLILYY